MKKIVVVFILLAVSQSYSQIEISTGMGIDITATPSLKNYLNSNFNFGNSQLKTFSTQVEFYGEGVYSVTDKIQVGIDYGVSLFTYNNIAAFNYELSYTIHKPSIVTYYVVSGKGYKFKFGGGGGIRFVNLDERILSKINYSGTGFGFLARAEGHTIIGSGFYAMIAADLRYDFINGVESNDNFLNRDKAIILGSDSNSKVNLNSFTVGVKLGISYFF